ELSRLETEKLDRIMAHLGIAPTPSASAVTRWFHGFALDSQNPVGGDRGARDGGSRAGHFFPRPLWVVRLAAPRDIEDVIGAQGGFRAVRDADSGHPETPQIRADLRFLVDIDRGGSIVEEQQLWLTI